MTADLWAALASAGTMLIVFFLLAKGSAGVMHVVHEQLHNELDTIKLNKKLQTLQDPKERESLQQDLQRLKEKAAKLDKNLAERVAQLSGDEKKKVIEELDKADLKDVLRGDENLRLFVDAQPDDRCRNESEKVQCKLRLRRDKIVRTIESLPTKEQAQAKALAPSPIVQRTAMGGKRKASRKSRK